MLIQLLSTKNVKQSPNSAKTPTYTCPILFQESNTSSSRLMARISRDAGVFERRARVPDAQPIQSRLRGHDARQKNLGPRIRKRRASQAHDQHDRWHTYVPHRAYGAAELRGAPQPHAGPSTETVQARTQTIRWEGADFWVGMYLRFDLRSCFNFGDKFWL